MSLRTAIFLLLLAACTARPLGIGDSATDPGTTGDATTTTGSGTLPTTSSSTTMGPVEPLTTDPVDPTNSGGCPFICPPDIPRGREECDVWTQDCPEGQKCMPYSGDGDNAWESLKCVDVVPDPDGMYEPCMVFGSGVSGEDTCDKGMMCWDVIDGIGYCIGQCIGSPDDPACTDPWTTCLISGDGVLTLCLPGCKPLVQNCFNDDLCIPNPMNPDDWICVVDASGDEGQAFDDCEYVNSCDKGLLCVDPLSAVECDPLAPGCCLPLCDLTLPNTCPGLGQECVPWYEEGMAPLPYANLGLCALPMP